MPEYKAFTADGQEATFDPVVHAISTNPELASARITGYDAKTRTIKATSDTGDMEFNVDEYAKAQGIKLGELSGDFNTPEQAVDSSPLSLFDRFRLGLASSETEEGKRLIGAVLNTGTVPELDARAEAGQGKALKLLRSKFEDAKIVNGEYVVKHQGVWHKADAPGVSVGDAVQFAAQNGLNILCGIAGGAVGMLAAPFTAGASVPAVATVGSAIGEGVEELLRVAIEGGAVDVQGMQRDMVTEGILGLVGEGAGKAITKAGSKIVAGASKVADKAVPDVAKDAATATIDGFKAFAAKADTKVKDAVASMYGNIGPGMSAKATREMLESPGTVQAARAAGAKAASGDLGLAAVHDEMVTRLQTAIDVAQKQNQATYGELVDGLAAAADDRIEFNLTQTKKELEGVLKGADKKKRGFLDNAIHRLDEMITAAGGSAKPSTLLDASGKVVSSKAPDRVLTGAKAIRAMHSVKTSTTEKLGELGVFDKTTVESLTDIDTLKAALKMEDLIDNKIMGAAKQLYLSEKMEATRDLYGATKDALRPLRSLISSEKRPVANAIKIAREEAGPDVAKALIDLHRLQPKAGVEQAVKAVRVLQSGLETQAMFALPKETVKQAVAGSGAVSILAGNPVIGGLTVGAMLSPRAAGFIARNLTSSGGAAQATGRTMGAAAGMTKQTAELAAKQLVRLGASTGFLHSLGRIEASRLLKNPQEFDDFNKRVQMFVGDAENATSEAMTKAAIKATQGGQGNAGQ